MDSTASEQPLTKIKKSLLPLVKELEQVSIDDFHEIYFREGDSQGYYATDNKGELIYLATNSLRTKLSLLSECTALEVLIMDHGDLNEIPKEIIQLASLVSLSIISSNIREIPEKIVNMHRLEELDLEGNW